MKETRATIVLARLARKKRNETGDHRYQAETEKEKKNLMALIKTSCMRPICQQNSSILNLDKLTFISHFLDLLATEPIVQSFSVGCLTGFIYIVLNMSVVTAVDWLRMGRCLCPHRVRCICCCPYLPLSHFSSVSTEFQAVYRFDIQSTGFMFTTLM
jgi:hypothetical protein